jgi:hypothetical protein
MEPVTALDHAPVSEMFADTPHLNEPIALPGVIANLLTATNKLPRRG